MGPTAPGWLRTRPIAHRGLHAGATVPENSRAAFARAAASGIPFELDVRLSRDGVPMVFHDATLARCCGDPRRLAELDRHALAGLRLFGGAETIPTLADALAIAKDRVPVLIELKEPEARDTDHALERAVADTVARVGTEVAVQSFAPDIVAWFARNAPDLTRGHLVAHVPPPPVGPGLAALATEAHFVAVELRALSPEYVAEIRSRTDTILAWTIRTRAERVHCAQHGFNPIFEDEGSMTAD